MRDWLDVARGAALLLIPGAFVAVLVMVAVMGIASLTMRDPVTTWGESAEFSQLMTGQERFSEHETNIPGLRVLVDHETGVQYAMTAGGVTPLLEPDGTPMRVLEAGE